MKFECIDCKKQFEYAAKRTATFDTVIIRDVTGEKIPAIMAIEKHACPYCESLNIQEVVEEPKQNPKITALIESPNAEVNARLAEGYEVETIYAKSTILVKRETLKGELST